MRFVAAGVVGLYLGAAPFLRYRHADDPSAAHRNHEARHGGQLGMSGAHHIELVQREGRVEVFVSDAHRRPLRPAAGSVRFGAGTPTALAWQGHRLVGLDDPQATVADVHVRLADGTSLDLRFDVS